MKLNKSNYYSQEANTEYFSVSQFKTFLDCEARAMAELKGEYEREPTKALLMGSYVDAYFSGELGEFCETHPEIFNKRTGELKAEFRDCEKYIHAATSDLMFMDFMDGEKQAILTGELFGVKWKIKADVLHKDRIVDFKLMRDLKPVYKDGEWKPFIDAWGYDYQAYVYQQIVEQNIGKQLPFYFAVITKEEHPDKAIIEMPQWRINGAGAVIEHYTERFKAVKSGEIEPIRCGSCAYCKDTKVLTEITKYEDLL